MISINNASFSGDNVVISNGKIVVDGKDVTPDSKEITILIDSSINSIKADTCKTIKVNGDVGSLSTMSGDVDCGNISGSVSTMSGDVDCKAIGGNVSTMSGDITNG